MLLYSIQNCGVTAIECFGMKYVYECGAHACANVSVWVTRGEHSQHGTPWYVLIVYINSFS